MTLAQGQALAHYTILGPLGVGRDGRIALIQLADRELAESRLQVVVGWEQELERVLASGR